MRTRKATFGLQEPSMGESLVMTEKLFFPPDPGGRGKYRY